MQVPTASARDSRLPFLPQCAGLLIDLTGMPCKSHSAIVNELSV